MPTPCGPSRPLPQMAWSCLAIKTWSSPLPTKGPPRDGKTGSRNKQKQQSRVKIPVGAKGPVLRWVWLSVGAELWHRVRKEETHGQGPRQVGSSERGLPWSQKESQASQADPGKPTPRWLCRGLPRFLQWHLRHLYQTLERMEMGGRHI